MNKLHTRLLPVCFVLAGMTSASVNATTIASLQADASYNTPVLGSHTLGPTIDSGSSANVDILHFETDSSGNNVGIHTYANTPSQSFGSRASGGGTYDVTSLITVNITGVGNTFASQVIPGQVYLNFPTGYIFGLTDFVESELKFALSVDGGVANFISDAHLKRDNTGLNASTTVTSGGFSIGYSFSSGAGYDAYTFGSSIQTISGLDILSPSFVGNHTLVYTIFAEAKGHTHAVACNGGGGGGNHPVNNANASDGTGTGTTDCFPGSGAQSGDPLEINTPEPGSMTLFGVGLAMLAWSRRQFRPKSKLNP